MLMRAWPVRSRPDLKEAAELRGSKQTNLAGFILGMDAVLGRLLDSLEDPDKNGDTSDSIAKNTLILFTSDNGGTHGDNLPLRGVKGMFTEGGIRVPLIAYWPGVIPANTITDRMVHGIDFYPTLLEVAGNAWYPSEKKHPLDGESFAKFLFNPKKQGIRSPIFYLFPDTWMHVPNPVWLQSMKSKAKDINYSIFMKPMNGSSIT